MTLNWSTKPGHKTGLPVYEATDEVGTHYSIVQQSVGFTTVILSNGGELLNFSEISDLEAAKIAMELSSRLIIESESLKPSLVHG